MHDNAMMVFAGCTEQAFIASLERDMTYILMANFLYSQGHNIAFVSKNSSSPLKSFLAPEV